MNQRFTNVAVVLRLLGACIVLAPISGGVAAQQTRPLDHSDVNAWNHITTRAISDNGDWAIWVTGPEEGDSELHIRHTTGAAHFTVPRAESPLFTGDGSHVVFLKRAPFDSTRQARIDERKKDDVPPDSVSVIRLPTGEITILDPAVSFKVPEDDGSWFAYMLTDKASKKDSVSADTTGSTEASKTEEPAEEPATEPATEPAEEDSAKTKSPDKPDTATLVVYYPADASSTRIDQVASYTFSDDGNWLAVSRSSDEGASDGVYLLLPGNTDPDSVMAGPGRYMSLVFDDQGTQLAFLSDRDDWPAESPAADLYVTTLEDGVAIKAVESRHRSLPEGWWVSEYGNLRFSEDGARLFFGTSPEPEPGSDEPELPENESVEVDVWSWTPRCFNHSN